MDLETLKTLLCDESKDNLIQLIWSLLHIDENVKEYVLEYCESKNPQAIDLIHIQEIMVWWAEVKEILEEEKRFGKLNYYDEEEVSDKLCQIQWSIEDNDIPNQLKKTLFEEMLDYVSSSPTDFKYSLIEACLALPLTEKEQLSLADVIAELNLDLYVNWALNVYLECNEDEKFLSLQVKNLNSGSDYVNLANYYKKKNQSEKAIKLLEEALPSVNDEIDDVYEWLFATYRDNNQKEKIDDLYNFAIKKNKGLERISTLMYDNYSDNYQVRKEILYRLPEICQVQNVSMWVERCEDELLEEDFKQNEFFLLSTLKKRNLRDYLQYMIDRDKLDEALECLLENPTDRNGNRIDWDHKISQELISSYPKEIYDLYWDECYSLCSESNKMNYKRAVDILLELDQISFEYDLKENWVRDFQAFLAKNKRKKLLLGYIDKAGLI